jgi:hypothetical protein
MFCGRIEVKDAGGLVIYRGPSFVRCVQFSCRKMVTNGYIERHGHCYCGGRRFQDAVGLLPTEIEGLRRGDYPLNEWEAVFVAEELARAV